MTNLTHETMWVDAAARAYQAQIPFTFRAGKVRMEAGRYQVWIDPKPAARMIRLHNVDARETLLLVAAGVGRTSQENAAKKLRFRVDDSRCALASLCIGGRRGAFTFHTPTVGREETAHVAEIELTPVNVD
jgi:hypothetical protein